VTPRYPAIFEEVKDATCLVVLLHAYTMKPSSLDAVVAAIRNEPHFPAADFLRPQLPMGMFSGADLNMLARETLCRVDLCCEKKSYGEIYFVGHSVGSLLARKVYVVAQGETEEAPFENSLREEAPRSWAKKVKRIILLAGMNRGWRISHHVSILRAIGMTILAWVGRIWEVVSRRKLLIFQIRRGAPFLTQLRLQWLAMRKRQTAQRETETATTIQLLGSIDDVVSPEDNIDLEAGRDFIYLDVGYSSHESIIEMADPRYGQERTAQFLKALTAPMLLLQQESVQVSDFRPRQIDPSVEDVIFVVHGIRDAGYWTQKIGRRIQKKAGKNRKFAMITSSYGYFPMAPFLMARKRREKVEWFMDRYAEARACYPNADFYCVGHSNGTYLIAKALELYPACRFDRIVFAGSVVQKKYKWRALLQASGRKKRVLAVTNYIATHDWVVAFFPKLFQIIGVQDLGSAGHDGFVQGIDKVVYDSRFVRGGHSAALDEKNWDTIAHFIVTGEFAPVPPELQAKRQAFLVRVLGFGFGPLLIWLAIITLLVLGARNIYFNIPSPGIRSAAMILYVWLIWKVLTRI
jgi:hypothetical protein